MRIKSVEYKKIYIKTDPEKFVNKDDTSSMNEMMQT